MHCLSVGIKPGAAVRLGTAALLLWTVTTLKMGHAETQKPDAQKNEVQPKRAEAPKGETAQSGPPGETSSHFDAKARAGKKDLYATLHDDGHFETLLKAMDVAGLAQTLRTRAPLTLFVPTDEAFAKLPAGTLDKWLKDDRQLKLIMRYHMIKAYVPGKQVLRLRNALTMNGLTVRIDTEEGTTNTKLNWKAAVTRTDFLASNGVAHAIDGVLVPPEHALGREEKTDKEGTEAKEGTDAKESPAAKDAKDGKKKKKVDRKKGKRSDKAAEKPAAKDGEEG